MTRQTWLERHAGGLGLSFVMVVWSSALLAWLPWWYSADSWKNLVAFTASALISLICIAFMIYVNHLELRITAEEQKREDIRQVVAVERARSKNN